MNRQKPEILYTTVKIWEDVENLIRLFPYPHTTAELAFVDYNQMGIDMKTLLEKGWVLYNGKAPPRNNVDVYFPKSRYVFTDKTLRVRDGSIRLIPRE